MSSCIFCSSTGRRGARLPSLLLRRIVVADTLVPR